MISTPTNHADRPALVTSAAVMAAMIIIAIAPGQSPESFGFFACKADLEDELIRALGTEAVERVLAAQDELNSFRRFQAMPQHRRSPLAQQLRRFLGTRATRKIRSAQHLVEALEVSRLPRPLAQLAERLRAAASGTGGGSVPERGRG